MIEQRHLPIVEIPDDCHLAGIGWHGLALALFLTLYRRGKTLDAGDWQAVREAGVPPTLDTEPLPPRKAGPVYPTLPAAGVRPPAEDAARV